MAGMWMDYHFFTPICTRRFVLQIFKIFEIYISVYNLQEGRANQKEKTRLL